ncbi:SDR family oxidoreductase [Planktothrix paucivesiculata]|uniref:Short-chain dehydrogenase (Modular protein) n=1 Tax=Planktothrix paucivesiculata PCC 9631 TaxID=671071 RepID=A0A7Z9E3N6_9CYAN|nr:SDR family oxidoreductase [Planktothrix paucivesiculata]VXD25275.1 Short-chain dehydrogenase (modular protein) [Planktothrix paucivesiculata PCC 9631]
MNKFNGLVALITGASSGIGAEIAKELARQGAKVALLARRIDRLTAIATKIDPSGQKVIAIQCDVAIDEEVEKAASFARSKFGKIDIVVANAGWSLKGKVADLSVNDYRKLFATNVFGVLNTIHATLDDLKKTQGRLVVISSVKSYIALSGDSAYSMSKFALRALCESLSQELAADGVSVIHICPGYVATEIRQVDNEGVWHPDWSDSIPSILLISPTQAAKEIVKAIAQRKPEKAIANYSKIIIFMKRHLPGLVRWIIFRFKIKVSYKM